MKTHNPLGLTPEELAGLEAFDAEVDQDDELTCAELAAASKRDHEHREGYNDNHLKRQREYNQKHREELRIKARKAYWANPEKHLAACRRWYAKNPEYKREYARAYSREHKDQYREKENARRIIWEPYGQIIKAARCARGWTLQELAHQLGLTHAQSVAKYETGRRPIDWERFRAVLPEIGPQPDGYPPRKTRPGRPRQWKGEEA